jgi:hypothetical protein
MAEEGHREAHTRAPSGIGEALQAFGAAVEGENGDLLSLLAQSVEHDADDTLAKLAKSVTEARKGAGRPLGSRNKRNIDVFDYLEGLGHRPPEMVLSLIATMDPRQLAVMMRRHRHFIAALSAITKAAEALLPYKLAKRSPDVILPDRIRPLMVMGDFNVTQVAGLFHDAGMQPRPHIIDDDAETIDISNT